MWPNYCVSLHTGVRRQGRKGVVTNLRCCFISLIGTIAKNKKERARSGVKIRPRGGPHVLTPDTGITGQRERSEYGTAAAIGHQTIVRVLTDTAA